MDNSDRSDCAKPLDVQARDDLILEARRRLLLKGVGKGSALLAAAAPISSFATNRVRTEANTLCTVSGSVSIISSATGTLNPCGAFHPANFVNCSTVDLNSCSDPLKTALNKCSLNQYYNDSIGKCYYFKKSSTSFLKLVKGNGWPAGWAYSSTVSKCFAGGGAIPIIQVIHKDCESDDSYHIAAYFNILMARAPSANYEKLPLDTTYAKDRYSKNKAQAANFYRTVCKVGKNPTKFV